MAVTEVQMGGDWFSREPVALGDTRKSALRAASMTGAVQVIHRHGTGEECESVVSDPDAPVAGSCFWVWPDLTWAGGNPGKFVFPEATQPEITEAEKWAIEVEAARRG